ncbi:MAG: hypothetical protein H6693_01500 [Candidatus Latescibacteria bacterium]|nr:hypothetical protein [bacterium]MCB9514848.1 hypothetical protein [Candidatus Latescibacterota bacterium]
MDARARAWREALFALLLVALTLGLYWGALRVFFSTDDLLFLLRAKGVEPWAMGTRRLLSVRVFFSVCWALFGERAALYHVLILLLHALNAWLLGRVAGRLGLSDRGAALAALLFLVSPVAFTSLHWISGVQDVMMATFALAALWAWLRRGAARAWSESLALVFYLAAILSKEAAFLLPVAAVLLPGESRARRLRAMLAFAPGLVLLYTGGAFVGKPENNPYATAYGLNVIWNAFTYSAWLVRCWTPFPDITPVFQPALWRWGLALPLLLAFLAWYRWREWAPWIGRASLMALLLLAPVLPLVRHSYLYYLYLPLAPLWLLAAAGLERLPARFALASFAVPLALLGLTAWRMDARAALLLEGKLQADPMLRYGKIVEDAVRSLRAAEKAPAGDVLVVAAVPGEAVDLAVGLEEGPNTRRMLFFPVDKAFYGGRVLPVFFPKLRSWRVVEALPGAASPDTSWVNSEIYALTGTSDFLYLGRGELGRRRFTQLLFQWNYFPRAIREVEVMLTRHPQDPDLLYDRGVLALATGDGATAAAVGQRLRELVEAETTPGDAAAALRDYEAALRAGGQQR